MKSCNRVLIEEEEGSDIFDTDLSCDRAGEKEEERSKLDGEQALQIDGNVAADTGDAQNNGTDKEEEEATSKEEMGGIFIYDPHAKNERMHKD